jgi:cytochrome c-type biogenesis protein CcmE
MDLTPQPNRPDANDPGLGHADVSVDAGLDLTPRNVPLARRRKRGVGAPVLLAVLLLGAGLIVFQFLNGATTFFCDANQAGAKKGCEVGKRFRLLGTVDNGSVQKGTPLKFTVSWEGSTIPVTYQGDPGGIFCEGQNVAVEGKYLGSEFAGERILVKHSEQYVAANPDRPADC